MDSLIKKDGTLAIGLITAAIAVGHILTGILPLMTAKYYIIDHL